MEMISSHLLDAVAVFAAFVFTGALVIGAW